MRPEFARFLSGAIVSAGAVVAARRVRALGVGGALAAWVVGTLVVLGGGWRAGSALMSFFASSSILSEAGRGATNTEVQAKSSERDATQVWANGGMAAVAALGMIGAERPGWASAYYGSIAAATADTWATEIGRGSRTAPRLLLVGAEVDSGTSGGMTPRGCAGAAAGAALIGCFAALEPCDQVGNRAWRRFAAAAVAGFAGALVDSLLGASLQEVRRCPGCGRETERASHCGVATVHGRGLAWLDNDGVNLAATVAGATAGWMLAQR